MILHGELEVLRLDRELRTVWRFSGRDLFASPTGERVFCLENGGSASWTGRGTATS